MKKKIISKINIIVLIAITFFVLYFSLKDNFNSIIDNIININAWWFILSILLVFGYWFFRSISYQSIITKFDKDYRFSRSFGLVMIAQFFNSITPFATGGPPMVIYTLKKDGIRAADGTNILIMDFITFQIALITMGTLAILYNHTFNIFKETYLLKELVTAGYILNIVIVVALFLLSFARKFNHFAIRLIIKIFNKLKLIKHKDNTLEKWKNRINAFHDGASILFKDKSLFVKLIVINMLSLLALYIIPMSLLFSFKDYTSFNGVEALATSAYVNLIGSFVPIPGGTGGLEFAFIQFFANFIKGSVLNAMMLLWRFITYYLGLIVGATVFNIWKGRD